MKYFFFNDCIPGEKSRFDYVDALDSLVRGYCALGKSFGDLPSVVSVDATNGIALAEGYSLSECIGGLKDRDLRRIAYSIFSHSPSKEFFDEDTFAADVVDSDYSVTIAGIDYDA